MIGDPLPDPYPSDSPERASKVVLKGLSLHLATQGAVHPYERYTKQGENFSCSNYEHLTIVQFTKDALIAQGNARYMHSMPTPTTLPEESTIRLGEGSEIFVANNWATFIRTKRLGAVIVRKKKPPVLVGVNRRSLSLSPDGSLEATAPLISEGSDIHINDTRHLEFQSTHREVLENIRAIHVLQRGETAPERVPRRRASRFAIRTLATG